MRAPGFRFRGRDEFLIDVLRVKAKQPGADVSAMVDFPGDLCELNLYGPGKDPWNLFSGDNDIWEIHDEEDQDAKIKEKYVLTKVTRIGKKNISRVAGAGCWLDKCSKSTPVVLGGEEVGYRKTLTYEYSGGDGAAEGKCHYYMHELRLSEYSLRQAGVSSMDYVVCRVLKDESKCCRIKNGGKRSRRCQDDNQDCVVTKRVRSCEVDQSVDHRQNQEYDFEIDPALMFDPAVLEESFDPNITLEDLEKSTTVDQEELARFSDELLSFLDSQEELVPGSSLTKPDHQAFGELYSGFSSCIGAS